MAFWSAFDDIITLICFALDICYRGYHMPSREYVFYPRASVQLNISRVNAIIKNNIIIIIRTFPESFSPEKFILGNKFVNFKRSNLLRSRNMSTNHEIPLILNLV